MSGKPEVRYTITAVHPADDFRQPMMIHTFDQQTVDRLTGEMQAKGFQKIAVKTEKLTP